MLSQISSKSLNMSSMKFDVLDTKGQTGLLTSSSRDLHSANEDLLWDIAEDQQSLQLQLQTEKSASSLQHKKHAVKVKEHDFNCLFDKIYF